jgi:hypothetical protein
MLSFASAPGNLFNRFGKIGALVANVRAHQLIQLAAMTDTTNGVVAQFDAESDIQALMGSAYLSTLAGVQGVTGLAQNLAAQTINRMVFRDNPRIAQNLTSLNTLASLQEVNRQMGVAGASVLAMTVAASAGAFTGAGNGVINASVRRPSDGRVVENAYAEDLLFVCTADSYTGGVSEGNETLTVTGEGSQPDLFAFDWPLGSDAQTALSAIDGNSDASNGNLLVNSGYSDFTANVPDNWSLDVGAGGTNVFEETTIVYDGSSSALRITGDGGGTLVELSQQFDSSTGTTQTLSPLTQYGYNVFMRRDGVAAGAGTLTIDLVDENGDVVADEGGTDNTFNIDLTALTTVYTSYKVQFRTPRIMPDELYLRMRLTAALTNGRSVYLDRGSLGLMTRLYGFGPYLCAHSGGEPFQAGDYATCTVSNSRGAAGTLTTFQTLLARLIPEVLQNDFLFLSSSVPTISDGLIA